MNTHEETFDLLAAFALDAIDEAEYRQIEQHVNECPRCASELVGLREVASTLGHCVEPVPQDLWSGISSRLVIPHEETPSSLRRLTFSPPPERKTSTRSRVGRRYMIGITAVAAGAVTAAGVLGISLAGTNDQNDRTKSRIGSNASTVTAALEAPGHKVVNLKNADQLKLAQFVVLPSGRGYLVSSSLPKLNTGQTYQLWATIDGQPISLGLLGQSPNGATFTIASSDSKTASELGVTVEPSGGSIVPTASMLASGSI